MKIKIKCPVCQAGNELTPYQLNCRRCKEDLTLLYKVKAYSYKYRLYLLRLLHQRDQNSKQIQLAHAATWLEKPIVTSFPVARTTSVSNSISEEE